MFREGSHCDSNGIPATTGPETGLTRKNSPYLLLWLAVIYVLAWYLQATLFLNYDVSWLMHATRRLLAGGTYSQNFFETNPPLILYLYLPPVLLSQFTGLDPAFLFRSYIFLLATVSLGWCALLLHSSSRADTAFMVSAALVFLILPCFDFGQRDHLLVILTLPYFLLMASRLEGREMKPLFALILGLFAGLGFSIKPHFLLTPLLLELYYAYRQRSLSACWRPETAVLLTFVLVYAAGIFLFFPDYLYVVLPYSMRLYYSAVSQPWPSLLFNGLALYCLFPLLLYCLRFKTKDQRPLNTVLVLGLVGFLVAYFSQRMTHYYHLIPALSLALLLLVIEFNSVIKVWPRPWLERIWAVLLAVFLFTIPCWHFRALYLSSLDYKKETLGRLSQFLNLHAKQNSVYFFVSQGSYAFPTLDYTRAEVAPRFYFLWMAAGLANQTWQDLPVRNEQLQRDKHFLINMISDDLYLYKPRYVFVDLSENKYRIQDRNFDYLLYFSENPKFRQEWRHYHYYTTLEEKGCYKLGVYKRSINF